MLPTSSIPHYKEICAALQRYGVSYAGLFGSRARGDNKKRSDYDFLVEFAPNSKTTLLGMMALQIKLEEMLGAPVDVVTKESISPYFRNAVLEQVLPFYETKS